MGSNSAFFSILILQDSLFLGLKEFSSLIFTPDRMVAAAWMVLPRRTMGLHVGARGMSNLEMWSESTPSINLLPTINSS